MSSVERALTPAPSVHQALSPRLHLEKVSCPQAMAPYCLDFHPCGLIPSGNSKKTKSNNSSPTSAELTECQDSWQLFVAFPRTLWSVPFPPCMTIPAFSSRRSNAAENSHLQKVCHFTSHRIANNCSFFVKEILRRKLGRSKSLCRIH